MVGLIAVCLLILRTLFGASARGDLTCPVGIRSFSKGAHSNSYYACEQEKQSPVLRTCSPGTYYWAYKQACHDEVNAAKTGDGSDLVVYSRPALGDTILLGDLYDSNTEEVLTGYSFWDRSTVLTNRITTMSPSGSINIFTTSSTYDRLQKTAFSSAIKLDIMGDLIPVTGSAAYLKDTLETEKEVAVFLAYRAMTHTETLPVSTPKQYEYCKEKGPTHVITSITRGIGVNFLFKKTVEDGESANEVLKDLKMAVNAIPTTKGDISEPIKKIVKNVHVNFYADFVAEKQPTNYEESLRVYQSLESLVVKFKKNTNDTVIMKFEVMPITRFCEGKRTIHIALSENILNSVNKMLGELEKTKLTIKTLKLENATQTNLPLSKILGTLLEQVTSFELQMKTDLRIILPHIHRGNSSEEDLVLLLNKYMASPFYYDNIEAFLDNRRREINMLDYILNPTKFEGTDITVLSYKEASDIKTMFVKPFVLMLKYNILPSKVIVRKFLKGETIDETKSWYNNPYIISAMGIQFNNFIKFSSSNKDSKTRGYLLAIADVKDDIINVNAQKEGLLYTFMFPEAPPIMASISNTHSTITFTVKRPSSSWVTGFRVSYRKYGSQAKQTSEAYQFSKSNVSTIEIDKIMANTIYEFSMQYLTPMGASPPSRISYFSTRPCSTPANLRTTMVASDFFKIYWDPPSTCGKGVHIRKYKLTVTGVNDFSRTIIVDGATSTEVKRLQAATEFNVSVQAIIDRNTLNTTEKELVLTSLPSSLTIITRPDAPSCLSLVNRSIHSVVVSWAATTKIPIGAILLKYRLKYGITNDLGNVHKMGTDMVVSSSKTSYHINDLIQGTTYSVSVKVMTTKGDSDYSPSLIVTTIFQKSQLDILRESLNKSVTTIMKKSNEVDNTIKAISNTPVLMVYYPRLRKDGYSISYATGCGGTINAAGQLGYPTRYWTAYYYNGGQDCSWDINTGLPTTLRITETSLAGGDYIKIFDEETYKGQYHSGVTVETHSGNAHVKFNSINNGGNRGYGFRLSISVRNVKRIAAQRYYPKYRATFSAYGLPKSYAEHYTWNTLPISNSSIPVCIKDCNERFVRDPTWNEVSIEMGELKSDKLKCTCYKNATGFTYSLSRFHYRIE